MLITDKNATQLISLRFVRNSIVLLSLGTLLYFFAYPAVVLKLNKQADSDTTFCDMEKVLRGEFIANGERFEGGRNQTSAVARSGSYSCLLKGAKDPQYTLGHNIKDVKSGDIYETSVWYLKKNQSAFVYMAVKNEDGTYTKITDKVNDIDGAGWSQLLIRDTIPASFYGDKLNVFVYTVVAEDVYFDDFEIKKSKLDPKETAASLDFKAINLGLQLNEKQFEKINKNRKLALKKSILITHEDSWVKGALLDDGKKKEASMRLKGDWLDHLQGNKWSFRVKLKAPQTFNRMTTFSVHTPKARYHAMEWLLHRFWEKENVLTTRYDFVDLSLNGKSLGIYAYEEHFEKQLVESNSRREGPILKFSEDALWKLRLHQRQTENVWNSQNIQSASKMKHAKIEAFKESKIAKSPTLTSQYEIGKKLLYQFQNGTKSASEIFDIQLMASYIAIADLMGAYHTLIWHNMRFYYNPISGKLEPIGFDGFIGKPDSSPKLFVKETLRIEGDHHMKALFYLFEDEAMVTAYLEAIFKITDKTYLATFVKSMRKPYNDRKAYLQTEFPGFDYDINNVIKRGAFIRKNYLPLSKVVFQSKWVHNNGVAQIEVINLSKLPFLINGFGDTKFPSNKILKPNESRLLTPSIGAKRIFFQVPGADTTFSNPIPVNTKWSNLSPIQKLSRFKIMPPSTIYKVEGENVVFQKGIHNVVKDIIIPAGHQVTFEPGCQLNFVGTTKFISQSPIAMNGTEASPITITSADGLANGFTVLKADGKSSLSHVHFTGLNTLNYQGWTLTGAVTFYESDVDISNSSFNDGKSEDGLNIVYSNFNLENITLDGAASDGFDADFCKGNIVNCIFKNTINDGVDVSGSEVLIEQTSFNNCGDKAISVGEESEAYLKAVTIDEAVIAVASKDLSKVTIESISMSNCTQGFTAYQKKPEFGSSLIVVEEYAAEDVNYLYKLGVGSRLQLGSRLIVGE